MALKHGIDPKVIIRTIAAALYYDELKMCIRDRFSCISAELVQDDGLAEAIEAMREEEIFRRAGLLMSRDIFH